MGILIYSHTESAKGLEMFSASATALNASMIPFLILGFLRCYSASLCEEGYAKSYCWTIGL
jgi:hypothetical protein